jgi:hypothetical protein
MAMEASILGIVTIFTWKYRALQKEVVFTDWLTTQNT